MTFGHPNLNLSVFSSNMTPAASIVHPEGGKTSAPSSPTSSSQQPRIVKSILKATKKISEMDLLSKMGEIAQHSKKQRQLQEEQEQKRRDKLKQEEI